MKFLTIIISRFINLGHIFIYLSFGFFSTNILLYTVHRSATSVVKLIFKYFVLLLNYYE